jgi:hypothetical protein
LNDPFPDAATMPCGRAALAIHAPQLPLNVAGSRHAEGRQAQEEEGLGDRSMLLQFAEDDTGAVAVDWVVLSAGLVGLGMATLAVVSGGLERLSGSLAAETGGIEIRTGFARAAQALEEAHDFADGIGAWIGGSVVAVPGFGEILQIGPGGTAELQIAVPEGASSATITFDLIGVDDLSGPPATVFIDGQPVAIYRDDHGNVTTSDLGVPGVSVNVTQHYTNSAMGGGSHGHDSRATYTITVDDPGRTLSFGVQNGSGQAVSEEYYAIDDVSVSTR